MDKLRYCKAFSLIEISISITIIALLIAAIVTGQNVRKRLELNQIIDQVGSLNNAVTTFKNSYGSLPGDIFNAQTLFPSSNLLNGNGNNILESDLGDPSRNEQLLFWQDLAAATLLDGNFDGVTIGDGGMYKTSLKNVYFQAITDINDNNRLYFLVSKVVAGVVGLGAFSTTTAFDYDTKYDNGDPTSGTIRSIDGTDQPPKSCIIDGKYNLTNKSDSACAIRFYVQ